MGRPLILSIFPGIDLLGRAFEEVWPEACIVRGPDLLWGGDIKTFHPPAGVFDGVIGGPPCQAFSPLRHLVRKHHGYNSRFGNMIPEFERCVEEARPSWFLAENVPEAPAPTVRGYHTRSTLVDAQWVGSPQRRRRFFSFGCRDFDPTPRGPFEVETLALHPIGVPPVISSDGGRAGKKCNWVRTPRYTVSQMLELQGAPIDLFVHSPFTVEGQKHALANAVPMELGRAVARAVRKAMAQ